MWTANRTGRWLFRRVHSAGHTVRTDRGTTVDPSTLQGVKELLPQNGYDWAMDYPHETQRIAQRMKFYNRHGFTAHDLTLYDTILCFTHTDASSISKLDTQSEKRAGTAKIIVLPGCRDISSEDCAKDPKKIQELISNIKTAIKGFISRELEDWNDGLVERTQSYRTLQLLLPGLNPRFEEANDFLTDTDKRKEYEIKSGCTIKVTKYKGSTKELLVSIVGPKEHLKEAAALVQSSNIAVS